jgi:hypothetical protein
MISWIHTPQDKEGFLNFKKETLDMLDGKKESDNEIINEFKNYR